MCICNIFEAIPFYYNKKIQGKVEKRNNSTIAKTVWAHKICNCSFRVNKIYYKIELKKEE
jgi:hypothetical protein